MKHSSLSKTTQYQERKRERERERERATARHFLEHMVHMRVIILQDATAIFFTDPCRHVHPIFQSQVSNNSKFTTYFNNMKKTVVAKQDFC